MFDASTLKGKALQDMAAELEIAGRSKMTAQELREAIQAEFDSLNAADHAAEIEDDELAAARALQRQSPTPMTTDARLTAYMDQRGTMRPDRISARQARRLRKKDARNGGTYL